MTRDPAEFEEIEFQYQKALAEVDEARRVFASQRTFETLLALRKVWSRKWDLTMIEMLATECPDVELETLMDMVLVGDVSRQRFDPKATALTLGDLDQFDNVRLASERVVEAQLAKARRPRRTGRVS